MRLNPDEENTTERRYKQTSKYFKINKVISSHFRLVLNSFLGLPWDQLTCVSELFRYASTMDVLFPEYFFRFQSMKRFLNQNSKRKIRRNEQIKWLITISYTNNETTVNKIITKTSKNPLPIAYHILNRCSTPNEEKKKKRTFIETKKRH